MNITKLYTESPALPQPLFIIDLVKAYLETKIGVRIILVLLAQETNVNASEFDNNTSMKQRTNSNYNYSNVININMSNCRLQNRT